MPSCPDTDIDPNFGSTVFTINFEKTEDKFQENCTHLIVV